MWGYIIKSISPNLDNLDQIVVWVAFTDGTTVNNQPYNFVVSNNPTITDLNATFQAVADSLNTAQSLSDTLFAQI